MKIVITKDEHLRLGFRDKFRKHGWEDDAKRKHQFIIDYMINNNIDIKITTGDILDKQTGWSFKQYLANKEILEMYKNEYITIFSIAGNHDMMEGKQTIKDSVFEEYMNQDLIHKVGRKSIFLFDSTKNERPYEVELHGIDYQDPTLVSKEEFFDLIKNLEIQDSTLKQILIIHQNVTPDQERVTEFTYDEISKICKDKGIDILICGHYHIGFPTITMNNVMIINPWNLWRVVRDYEVQQDQHFPEFVVLNTDTMKIEHIEVPHKKYIDAFDLKEINFYEKVKKENSEFFKLLNEFKEEEVEDLSDIKKELYEKIKLIYPGISEEKFDLALKDLKNRLDI